MTEEKKLRAAIEAARNLIVEHGCVDDCKCSCHVNHHEEDCDPCVMHQINDVLCAALDDR